MFTKKIIKLFKTAILVIGIAHAFETNAGSKTNSTPVDQREATFNQKLNAKANSPFNGIKFNNIGPTVMSGRVTDIEVNPNNVNEFYVAYASGGLFHTLNNGLTFSPVFDHEASITIGDIAVDWANQILWIGTGENNSSRSSYAGTGIYKSIDGGKNWQCMGLAGTQHIGRIILNPNNKDEVQVAAIGHLYTFNTERGIYKTIDGGKNWKQTLFINDSTGVIDLIRDPHNNSIIYSAAWQRERKAWNFKESGEGSAIYKSENNGDTWIKITLGENGFPQHNGVGRIGLAMSEKVPNLVYAVLDNQARRPVKSAQKNKPEVTPKEVMLMSTSQFLALQDTVLDNFIQSHDYPQGTTAQKLKQMVGDGEITPQLIADYLADANADLFETEIIGAELYKSADGGKNWVKVNEEYLDDFFYTYGYYFGQVRIAPNNPNHIYLLGLVLLYSEDGGKHFKMINPDNVHGDHHALWINPNNEEHIINGNDGGVNISYDNGKSFYKCNTVPVGQLYAVDYDMNEPYNVYCGLQDNGVWVGPSTYQASPAWYQEGIYPYKTLMGGDGMQVQVDFRDNTTVYCGFQFGYYYRVNKNTQDAKLIMPKHQLGEAAYRFNWQTPILLSRHNQDVLYYGSNKFHRSFDKGDTWQPASIDLTNGGKKGDVAFGTLTTIAESPIRFGKLYTGSDDGAIHLSNDGGYTWKNINGTLPKNLWISRIIASAHNENTIYVSLNGYRNDDFSSYLYKSTNDGASWQVIGSKLPAEPINAIAEDKVNRNLIFVGTDNGLYCSTDGGLHFSPMMNGIPHVAVHDLKIHPRERDLIVGTHGRSIFVANVADLQKLNDTIQAKPIHIFEAPTITFSKRWGKKDFNWLPAKEPKASIRLWNAQPGLAQVSITNDEGKSYYNQIDTLGLGFNTINLPCVVKSEPLSKEAEVMFLQPGVYTVSITLNGIKESTKLTIEEPRKNTTPTPGPAAEPESEIK